MMSKVSRWLIVLALTFISEEAKSDSSSDTVYLGLMRNALHCSNVAYDRGYPYNRFGGYINGFYYWNACFGVKRPGSNPPPSGDCNFNMIKFRAESLIDDARYLENAMRNNSSYRPVWGRTDQMVRAAQDLAHFADLNSSCRYLKETYFNVLQPALRNFSSAFLPIYQSTGGFGVTAWWDNLLTSDRNLRGEF